jgi:hypothetical protein
MGLIEVKRKELEQLNHVVERENDERKIKTL